MRLRYQITIFTIIRTIFNTMHRMVYPFLGVFARGIGVDLTSISLVMTSRSLVGMFIPFISPISDSRGRRFGMLAGTLLFTFAVALVAIYPSFYTMAATLILALLGKYLFDPAMQAYLGDRIPYERRGLALAFTEMGWSFAFIGGIPLVTYLISTYGWSAPFPVLMALGVLVFLVLWYMVPREDSHHQSRASTPWTNFRSVLTNIPALAGISIALWASAANEMVNLVFGVWLEDSFGMRITALALASLVIGASELLGEGLVAVLTDWLGKPRALGLGLAASAVSSLALPLLGQSELGALVGLFFFYITFEFVMVSHVPMMTEVLPGARATVMSFNLAGHSIGRALGAFLATFIYQSIGFTAVAGVALVFYIFGLLALRQLKK